MKRELNKLVKDFELEFEERKVQYEDGTNPKTYYLVRGFSESPALDFMIREKEDISNLRSVLELEPYFYKDFIAIQVNNQIQIALSGVGIRSFRGFDRDEEDNSSFIDVHMNYFKNDLKIEFRYASEEDAITKYVQILRGAFRYRRRPPLIIQIDNLTKPTTEGLETDTRNIINSILFDIEYTYGHSFETINLESLTRRFIRRSNRYNELPNDKIELVYKKYIPELIEYFHIGEKVDYLPFKFICYYHVIEYFSDKSAYHVVSEYIKKLILKPDFHNKTNHYVGQAVNFFKKESDRYTTDKIKRVLRQFIDKEELKNYLQQIELLEYFEQENEVACNKPLKLPKIDFDSDGNFFQNLTKRIYSIRCSIVHSNPDFDDSKAIPFIPTPKNLDILRLEMELMYQIARTIIVESKEE